MPHSKTFALGMAAVAWLAGLAIHLNNGYYSRGALLAVSVAILIAAWVMLRPPVQAIEQMPAQALTGLIAMAIVSQSAQMVSWTPVARGSVAMLGALSLLQMFELGRLRRPVLIFTVAMFCVVASIVFLVAVRRPAIDVFVFQQIAAEGLLNGVSPYVPRYPNVYGIGTPFYGPGVVDASNHVTVGLPYPPMSLLLALPGYVLGGDVRFADVAAVAGSAGLMALSGPLRWTALTALLFLLTPRALYVIGQGWTETLFVFTFSLVMFCAIRWRRGLPVALALFFATKQYSVLSIPLLVLLLDPSDSLGELWRLIGKAAALAALVTVPFFVWDPYNFWRSVVEYQFMQPLRMDALSHLVWMHARVTDAPWIVWIPFVLIVPTAAVLMMRCVRSPAQFAGAVTLLHLVFFAFNKQAFSNYYYFVIATACWAATARSSPEAATA